MGTGYTRNDTGNNIADGNVINASDLDGEFDALEDAFDGSTGHSHDGTTGEGPQIDTAGLANDAVTAAKLDETESFTMAGLTVTTSATFNGATVADLGTVTTADINGGSIDGVTIGTNSAATEVQIDNININGNTISSTDTNGNIILTPDGTGEVDISKVDIASGEIDGTNIGANSAGTGNFSTLSIAGTAITSTATELNILDGVTSTTAELNILDGVTADATELNILDGVTATTAELNYLDISTLGTTEASKAVTADANGVVTFDNGTIEEVTALSGTSVTIDLQDGNNFTHSLSGNTTYTFSNPGASGRASAFTLKVVQDSTARTITWPASVDWAGGEAPTISDGNGDVDYFVFITTDGGTNYYGFTAGQALA